MKYLIVDRQIGSKSHRCFAGVMAAELIGKNTFKVELADRYILYLSGEQAYTEFNSFMRSTMVYCDLTKIQKDIGVILDWVSPEGTIVE